MPDPVAPQTSELDAAFEPQRSRFIVGIDLGTTNCAMAMVDSRDPKRAVQIVRVEQLADFGSTMRSETLPSFHYELTESETAAIDARFRFGDDTTQRGVVGILARERSLQVPGRGIGSAKSWLCHTQVDRTSDMLPWHGDEDVPRLSPVEVSRRYLEFLRRQWDREHPQDPLSDTDVVVTLPASFDEVARQLTLEAARKAGLPNVVLIEEPQAAFYAWLHAHADAWMDVLTPGETILVCDIGGGTTDFTLIRVIDSAVMAQPQSSAADACDQSQLVAQRLESAYGLHRVAVGQHLMLGGDNLDLALAKHLESRLLADMPGVERLSPRQWDALKAHARRAKETLLSDNPPESYSISLPASGSKLIASSKQVLVERDWARRLLVDGFFGRVPLESRPESGDEGFHEFGLPYEHEPNVHKHLAAFLWDHRWAGRPESDRERFSDALAARPDWVLFNGGVLESSAIRSAILDQIAAWFATSNDPDWKPRVLEGNRLDLAVAQGAAYFGLVRRGEGIRIDARLARSYYLLVNEQPPQALCIMPASAMPLDRFRCEERPLELTLGEPVRFPLYSSSSQLTHAFGQIVDVDPTSMTPLAPLQTVLNLGRKDRPGRIPILVESQLSEIGTLTVSLVTALAASDADASSMAETRWNLEFDVRGSQSVGERSNAISPWVDAGQTQSALGVLESIFGPEGSGKPKDCFPRLTESLGVPRRDWPAPLLRELWRYLADHADARRRSPEHEARWLNLAGWTLRPGYGFPADDWRVQTTWRLIHNKLMHRSATSVSEAVVLWRRIAGGFTTGQQNALFQDTWARVKPMLGGTSVGRDALNTNVAIELIRLLGSLERIRSKDKALAGELALSGLQKKKLEPLHGALLWMIGRMGARVPVYATIQQTLPLELASSWIEKLLDLEGRFAGGAASSYALALMLIARKTGDRYRDLPSALRDRVVACLQRIQAPEMHARLVAEGGSLDADNVDEIVGDALPLGFSLIEAR
ncbi:MAG: Hsp70 family protein [Pirellula sp.]